MSLIVNSDDLLGKKMKKWFVFWMMATTVSGACFAQEKPATKKESPIKQTKEQPVAEVKHESKKLPAIRFSMGMLENGRVDLKYTGFSIGDVIGAIELLTSSKKGEFESTADYNARKSAAFATKFLDGSSVEDLFAFVLPVPKGGKFRDGIRYEFNADSGVVNLYALPKSSKYLALNGIGGPDYQAGRNVSKGLDQFIFSTQTEDQGTYEASNAYGATTTVEKSRMSRAGIAVNRIPFLKFERELLYPNPVVASQFKLGNIQAAAELPVLKALVVMKLSDPYVLYNYTHIKPQRDSPTDIVVQEKYLTGDVLGIVYYSGLTGEIFARLPETFGKP